jgi:toxin ParE1/3/4
MPRSPPRPPKRPAPPAEPRVTVRQAALDDLEAIGVYTLERWGERQFVEYLTRLHNAFRQLAANPGLGKSADDVRKGYWRHHEGSHMVYFKRKRGGVEIVRVLHERMSPRRHL